MCLRNGLPHLLRRRRCIGPNEIQNCLLQLRGRSGMDATICHVTECSSQADETQRKSYGSPVNMLVMLSKLLAAVVLLTAAHAADRPIPIKVVVVTMFERGADTGDEPGEFQYWVEREKLDRVLPFPAGYRDLRMNRQGVLGMVTGIGTAKAAASIMALGLDPRFDLRQRLLARRRNRRHRSRRRLASAPLPGPSGSSMATSATRSMPAKFRQAGRRATFRSVSRAPTNCPVAFPMKAKSYRLNPALVDWAYRLTADTCRSATPRPFAARARTIRSAHRASPPVRPQGRHALVHDVLARKAAQPVGQ